MRERIEETVYYTELQFRLKARCASAGIPFGDLGFNSYTDYKRNMLVIEALHKQLVHNDYLAVSPDSVFKYGTRLMDRGIILRARDTDRIAHAVPTLLDYAELEEKYRVLSGSYDKLVNGMLKITRCLGNYKSYEPHPSLSRLAMVDKLVDTIHQEVVECLN